SPTPFVFLSMSGAFGLSQSRFFFSANISTPELTGAKNCGTTGTSPFQITRPCREATVVASKRSDGSAALVLNPWDDSDRPSSQPSTVVSSRIDKTDPG